MFKPDYNNIVMAARNQKPNRIPLYDHGVDPGIMERISGKKFAEKAAGSDAELDDFFKEYDRFFLSVGYDTVTYEGCVTEILPFGGALAHPRPGYIDSVEKFESYPFDKVKDLYIEHFDRRFKAMKKNLPDGMRAIGGVGNGIFEVAQDLAGYENLCILSFEEPELYARLFEKVGDMMCGIWEWFLKEHGDAYCVCRMGDDLGYKSNTMLSHEDIKTHVIPQYKRIVSLVHSYNKPFLLHSCGCIFAVMDEIIEIAGIDAKHSNEDQIAPFSEWIDRYGSKIGNFGGIDTDHLVRMENGKLQEFVKNIYAVCDKKRGGCAIGSGNSIPAYVDPEKYLIMLNTVRACRGE